MLLLYSTAALLLGFLLDLLIGDPRGIPHIIVLIGRIIGALERPLRSRFGKDPAGERAAGRTLVVLMLLFAAVLYLILLLCYRLSPWLCMHDLKKESMTVFRKLKEQDLDGARHAVSMIVGRDTEVLDAQGVAKAAVESVAENTSDGVVAPLFYLFLFGPLGGLVCKTVNTMDSMVGYRNERFLNYGRAAALTDDVFNFLPARISALLMIVSAKLTGLDARNAYRIWRRDRFNHDSPNSAQTESAVAGALHVRLAGDARYFGVWHEKKFIGDEDRQTVPEDIPRTNRLMMVSSVIVLAVALAVRAAVILGGHMYAAV